ncbi:VOC family protein [Streptomyces sp. JNUCC 64]
MAGRTGREADGPGRADPADGSRNGSRADGTPDGSLTDEMVGADEAAGAGTGRNPGAGVAGGGRGTVLRMEHVGVVVDDLAAATDFFVALGLEPEGEGPVEGRWVDRVVGLDGVRARIAVLRTPDGHGRIELAAFQSPVDGRDRRAEPANAPGLRHVAFSVDDLDSVLGGLRERGVERVGEVERYEDVYRLCYVRGPEGIIVELAERIGG